LGEKKKICPACGSEKFFQAFSLAGGRFNRCLWCSLVFFENGLSEKELKEIYDREDYQQFSYYVFGLERMIALERLEWLSKKLKLEKGAKILDFGCGDGLFLQVFREAHPEYEFFGFDLSEIAVERGKKKYGLNLFSGEIEKSGFPDNFFDLITLYHVIEHLNEPSSVVKKLYQLARPQGKIVITTPNEDYLLLKALQTIYRLFGGRIKIFLDKFYNLEHINSFSEKSLRVLLERCGFKVVDFWQGERYLTRFCLSCFNFFEKTVLEVVTFLSRLFQKEAEITLIGEKDKG